MARPSFSNVKTKYRILVAVAIPLALFIAMAGVMTIVLNGLRDNNAWVKHTQTVLAEANGLVAHAVDMETGMRGFLLAGNEDFLAPFTDGSAAFETTMTDLSRTVSDNPAQVARLAEADGHIQAWLENAALPAIALRREIGDAETMNDVAALVREERGKVFFDRFREQIGTFIDRERTLLERRNAEAETARRDVGGSVDISEEALEWVAHTYRAIGSARQLLAHAIDMETGMRGYLLAGDRVFLEPYDSGSSAFFDDLAALQTTVSDNPAQVARLDDIRGMMESWVATVAEPAFDLRLAVNRGVQDPAALQSFVGEQRGKQFFDAIRAEIDLFVQAEQTLLEARYEEATQASDMARDQLGVLAETTAWATHTYDVIGRADAILMAALNMETGVRGYLLAGADGFLAPYDAGAAQFDSLIEGLRTTVDDNPPQVALLGEIAATIGDWQTTVVDPMIALRREIGTNRTMDDMADLIGEERGKEYFDAFRASMGAFQDAEAQLMAEREAAAASMSSLAMWSLWICVGLGLLLGGGAGLIIGNGVANPILRMTRSMGDLADGKMDTEIPGVGRKDEVGEMAGAVQVFKDNMIRNEDMAKSAAQKQEEQIRRAQKVAELTQEFDRSVKGMLENVSTAVTQLQSTASSMTAVAGNANEQATAVAAAAEQATSNVETVSAASEQLSSSIAEISRQVSQSTDIATQAVNDADETNQRVQKLQEGAQKIGDVVNLITSIAEQTNLLALNATIEAARAGDAGKGFAVVASEVKSLATQTGQATEEIAQQIQTIQSSTGAAVQAIEKISGRIREMATISTGIAAAVEEQDAATQEIARNVQEAATGTRQVSTSIVMVSEASQQTGAAAAQVDNASGSLADQSQELKGFVQRFLDGIRAA